MDLSYAEVTDGMAKGMIVRLPDRAWIPPDPANTDYLRFLAWVAEGNTPEVIEP